MKTHLTIPTGAVITVKLKSGKTIGNDEVAGIEIKPFFSGGNAQAPVVHVETILDDGFVVERVSLLVSGSNGKSFRKELKDLSVSAIPAIEKKRAASNSKPGSK
jgi:hypothetical protein